MWKLHPNVCSVVHMFKINALEYTSTNTPRSQLYYIIEDILFKYTLVRRLNWLTLIINIYVGTFFTFIIYYKRYKFTHLILLTKWDIGKALKIDDRGSYPFFFSSHDRFRNFFQVVGRCFKEDLHILKDLNNQHHSSITLYRSLNGHPKLSNN
jgi:hypothetical protein